jgi:hypothetical protein
MADESLGVSPESSANPCPPFNIFASAEQESGSIGLHGPVETDFNGVRLGLFEGVEGDFIESPALFF